MKDSWYKIARAGAVIGLAGTLNGCGHRDRSSAPSDLPPVVSHQVLRKMSEDDASTWLIQNRVRTLAVSFPENSIAQAVYIGNSPGLGLYFDLPVPIKLSQKPFALTTFDKPLYGATYAYLSRDSSRPVSMQQIRLQPVTMAFSYEWLDADPQVQALTMRKEALRIEIWVGMGMALLQDFTQQGTLYAVDGEIIRERVIHSLVRRQFAQKPEVWKLFYYASTLRILDDIRSLAQTDDPKVLEDLEKAGMLEILRKAQAAGIDFRPEAIETDFRRHAFDRREPWPRLILSDPDIQTPPPLSWSGEF